MFALVIGGEGILDRGGDLIFNHGAVIACSCVGVFLEPIEALPVDDFALAIDDVIVFDDALANIKVVALRRGSAPVRWTC